MAEDQDDSQKTEDPTQKRLEEARKKGDVVKSQDVPAWFLLMTAAGIVAAAGPMARQIADPLVRILDHPQSFHLANGGAMKLMHALVMSLLPPMGMIFATLLVGSVIGHVIQVPPLWTFEKMKPDLEKLSPAKGLSRMFGPQGWVNLLKAALKIVAVGGAMVYAIWPSAALLTQAGALDVTGLLGLAQTLAGRMFIAALIAIGVIAGLDYFWQRMSFMNRMKMSKRDIRDEHKQSEGDPQIKAKLRMIRMKRAQKRMMAAVPKATVIINNPTHYSVALRYVPEEDAAPVCVAKGVDEVALRIREIAKENGVPMIENIPLARALYASVEIDDSVPREHFEAVAKVIGFVLNTAKGRRKP
jgi:flagellar biosynthetic protein FlhB